MIKEKFMKLFVSILLVFLCIIVFSENIIIFDYKPDVIDNTQKSSFINEFNDNLILSGNYKINTLFYESLPSFWHNSDILISICDSLNIDKAIIFKYYAFGDNFVVKMAVLDIKENRFTRIEEFSLTDPRELKTVAKKAALMITQNKSVKELEEVGLIIPNEQKEILERRNIGLKGISFSAGYMWSTTPADQLYAGEYRKVLLLAASLPIEVSRYGRMDITFDLLIAASVAATVGYTHIFKPTTISPYLGADAGIEYVYNRSSINPTASIGGIVLRPKVGYLVMNTFKTSLFIEAAYRVVTNDFLDSGFEFRFGFILR